MYGADPRHFMLGTKSGCRKLFGRAGVSYPARARRICGPPTTSSPRSVGSGRRGPASARPWSSTTRASRAPATRCEPRGSARAGRRGRARRRSGAAQGDEVRERPADATTCTWGSWPSWRGSSRSASSARRSGAPACRCASPPRASSRCCRRTTRCSGGPSGQSYLGCRFPADPAYATLITRDAVKVGQELVGEGRPRALRLRLRRRPERRRLDALRDRAEPAEGRHDPPVPDAPVPDRRPLRRRRPAGSRRRAAARSASSRPTTWSRSSTGASSRRTSSTSWSATGSTSTRPGRPASSSTC